MFSAYYKAKAGGNVQMLAEKFTDWLDGYLENIDPALPLSKEQVEKIKKRLSDVFIHEIDPQMNQGNSPAVLQAIHDGNPTGHPQGNPRC